MAATPATIATLPPSPPSAPALTTTPEEPQAQGNVPALNDIAQHTPTPKPAAKEHIGEHLAPATQAASVPILPQPQL